ncbi:hypothetical protein EVAR_14473_1 [Eumeta japonica]|uniref:Uncharacterized protein n=1 Tax=Eumeta variegata TaxID=151549 RepID=A0A4C1U3B1_EUMVA|nr:hypothetical protein EVAR_14473_1 [Eumeta japonica]
MDSGLPATIVTDAKAPEAYLTRDSKSACFDTKTTHRPLSHRRSGVPDVLNTVQFDSQAPIAVRYPIPTREADNAPVTPPE